jgi:two-component system, sensor histidine kinase YesM
VIGTNKKSTIKSRIILIMTIFALLIASLLSVFSYELISFYQRKTTIQATKFNLQLISNIIEQDLYNLSALAMKCSTNSATNSLLMDYFQSANPSPKEAVDVFSSMQEDFRVNPSNSYVRRLIATDNKETFLQVDNSGSLSVPLNIHNISLLPGLHKDAVEEWGSVVQDPFSTSTGIPFIFPIYGNDASRIGTVYLLANTSVITDKLKGYSLPDSSRLLLTLGGRHYQITEGKITPSIIEYEEAPYKKDSFDDLEASLSVIQTGSKSHMAVSYPIREGVVLTQTLAGNQLAPQVNIWILLMIGVCFLVIASSGIITVYLTRMISLPVEKLKKRMDKIAQGQFTVDKNIEWNSELGDVGRGINRLSQDILALMENRVAHEKQKQELEYRVLQSQINPHFLYNTLNSIKWMATIQNATGIAEMTTSLSRLLRSIAKDIGKLVTLKDELSLLDDYFLIQKYRYGSTISMDQHVEEEELLSSLIPRFTLQPLVENAIFHGVEPKSRGRITVTITRQGVFDLQIIIEDDGVGMEQEQIAAALSELPPESKGLFENVGLRSVNERLRLAFGERYGISIESQLGSFTRIKLFLPFQAKE